MLNLSQIFDCFSRRFDKVVFNLKLSHLVDSTSHLKAVTSRVKLGACENRRLSLVIIMSNINSIQYRYAMIHTAFFYSGALAGEARAAEHHW